MFKFRLLLLPIALICSICSLNAIPQWWIERGISESESKETSAEMRSKNRMDVAVTGQAMFVAKRAAEELEEKASGGAGNEIEELINTFTLYDPKDPLGNKEALDVERLNEIAKPFYKRLWELENAAPGTVKWPNNIKFLSSEEYASGLLYKYPWDDNAIKSKGQEGDIVKIGQVKFLFSWSLESGVVMQPDVDGDGISDSWESVWNQNTEALRFLRVEPIGGNIKTAANGESVSLGVRVVDERGIAISGAPLSILSDAGVVASSGSTNAIGEYTYTHVADFTSKNENTLSVGVQSSRGFGSASFFIRKRTSGEFSSDSGELKPGWNTDSDPTYGGGDDDEKEQLIVQYASIGSIEVKYNLLREEWTASSQYESLDRSEEEERDYSKRNVGSYISQYETIDVGSYFGREHAYNIHQRAIIKDEWKDYFDSMSFYGRCFYVKSYSLSCKYRDVTNWELYDLIPSKSKRTLTTREEFLNVSESWSDLMSLKAVMALYEPVYQHLLDYGEGITTYFYYLPWIYNYPVKDFHGIHGTIATLRDKKYPIAYEDSPNLQIIFEIIQSDRFDNDITLHWFSDQTEDGTTDESVTLKGKESELPHHIWFEPRISSLPTEGKLKLTIQYVSSDGDVSTIEEDIYNIDLRKKGDTQNYSFPADESAGPRYRKVSLAGRPMADDKPQTEAEDDIEPLETYIDAMSLQLRHDAVDISIPVPGSEMSLALRRNYKPLVWNYASGLRPHESPEHVFGGNWSTNLVSFLRIDRQILADESKRTSPDTATAYDENGGGFSFACINLKTPPVEMFYPMPSGRSEKQNYLNSLYKEGDFYVLKKRYGTTLYYSANGAISMNVASDRINGSNNSTGYSYYRLEKVVDRYGNTIKYEYPYAGSTLIPSKVYVEGCPDLAICLEQADGRIVKAWDAEGNIVKYDYAQLGMIPASVEGNSGNYYSDGQTNNIPYLPTQTAQMRVFGLSEVKKGVSDSNLTTVAAYDYEGILARLDNFSTLSGEPHFNFHVNLREVSDGTSDVSGNPRTWKFDYGAHLGLYSYDGSVGYYIPTDRPLTISRVTLPSGDTASFSSDSDVKFGSPDGYALTLSAGSRRKTTVTDADGNRVVYTWLGQDYGTANLEFLVDFRETYGFGSTNPFSNPLMIYFPDMRIEHFEGSGDSAQKLGEETFKFDIGAGMALKEVVDFSGNVTEYEYNDPLFGTFVSSSENISYASRYSDPTSETKGGYTKTFTYSPNYRIMDSMTDELGRKTEWTVDEKGRRTAEKVYANSSDASSGSGAVKETLFEYDTTFPGFLAKTTILNGAGQGKNMVTQNVPDSNGRIASSIVDPGGLNIATSFEYNRNGRKTLQIDPNGNSTAFEYDAFNRLTKVTNPDGSIRQILYDNAGRKIAEKLDKDSSGDGKIRTLYAYNPNGLMNRTELVMGGNEENIVTLNEYSPAGKILKTTDANGNDTLMKYDGMGRLMKMAKYEGAASADADPDASSEGVYVTKYNYEGNCGSGVFSTDNFKPSEVTDARGNTSLFEHDAWYRETKVSLPYGDNEYSVTEYTYDAVGNKISEKDALGNITSFEYDTLDNLIETTFADGVSKQSTYSSAGLVLSEIDEMNFVTSHEYDKAGRKVQTIFPEVYDGVAKTNANPVEKYAYDNNGNLITKWDATNRQFNTVYDSMNRVIAELQPAVKDASNEDNLARPTKITKYDLAGNAIETTDPNGNTTVFEFDNAGRTTKITFPEVMNGGYYNDPGPMDNPIEEISYDGNGNIILKTNPRGIITATTYNSYNKPLLVTKDANADGSAKTGSIVEQYAYDYNGNIDTITDGNGNKTKYEHDAQNRRTKAIYGYGSATTRSDEWEYDKLNMTKRKGVPITYDNRNRMLQEGAQRAYSYDACGRISSASGVKNGKDVSAAYTYDALGRYASETNGGKTHRYEYDLAGRQVLAEYDVNGEDISHSLVTEYDAAGRMEKQTDHKNRATLYAYDLNGNVKTKTNQSGLVLTNSYDALNRLIRRTDNMRFDLNYFFDLGGNLVCHIEFYDGINDRKEMYSRYDAFDRLVEYNTYDDSSIIRFFKHTYDKNSNRLSEWRQQYGSGASEYYEESRTYTVNILNQISEISVARYNYSGPYDTNPSGNPERKTVVFAYDDRGNRVLRNDGTQSFVYAYNEYDQLDSVTLDGDNGYVSNNYYDYRGRRIARTVSNNGNTGSSGFEKDISYSYSGGTSVMEHVSGNSGEYSTLFYRGPDQGGGVGGINYAEKSDGSDLNYKFCNLRGDVLITTTSSNVVKFSSTYTAWGAHDDSGTIATDRHRANSKVEDEDGLLNEGWRFRSIEDGVFLTPDPLEYVDGLNPYIYCNQNPWGRWDPLGLAEKLYMNFYHEGVGINDPIVGPAPAGYTARNAEVSTNVLITGTGFTPAGIYILAVEMNVSSKNSVGDKVLSSRNEKQTNYFEATADAKGNIDFGKAANIGQDDGNPGDFVNFQKGATTNISVDIDASVAKSVDTEQIGLTRGDKSAIKNFVGVENGKAIYEGDGSSGSIFGPQNAHANIKGAKRDNKVRGTADGIPYMSDVSIASVTGSIKIKHVGGSKKANVTTSGISGKFSNGEGRTNVNITHKKE